MRWIMVLLVTLPLVACQRGGAGVPAPSTALACAQRTVAELGYRVVGGAADQAFVAEKEYPRFQVYRLFGEITAALSGDGAGGYRLRVEGQRFEQRDPEQPGTPGAGLPGIAVDSGVVVGSRRRGRYRISPGPVAGDVEIVRERCASASAS